MDAFDNPILQMGFILSHLGIAFSVNHNLLKIVLFRLLQLLLLPSHECSGLGSTSSFSYSSNVGGAGIGMSLSIIRTTLFIQDTVRVDITWAICNEVLPLALFLATAPPPTRSMNSSLNVSLNCLDMPQ